MVQTGNSGFVVKVAQHSLCMTSVLKRSTYNRSQTPGSVQSDINSSTKNTLALEMEDLFSVEINLSVESCEATALASVQTLPTLLLLQDRGERLAQTMATSQITSYILCKISFHCWPRATLMSTGPK